MLKIDHKRPILLLLLLLCIFQSYSQDTVSIYFDTGKHKIVSKEESKLILIPSKFELGNLDSIYITGMADSIGDLRSNLKLSLRRANNVYEYLKKVFPKDLHILINAVGENTNTKDPTSNRRVDIILYNHIDIPEPEEIIDSIPKLCYEINYKLLHKCNIRTVIKGKKEYVIIEPIETIDRELKNHYYVTLSKAGKLTMKPVKWQFKVSGSDWWKKSRYSTTILKEDYERYKIFTKNKPPCTNCNQEIEPDKTIQKEERCLQLDRFIMHNLQINKYRRKKDYVIVRVPKEYVDLTAQYFAGCDEKKEIKWQVKKGKRKQKYFYTNLPVHAYLAENIIKKTVCCKFSEEPSHCDEHILGLCGTFDTGSEFTFETGYNYYSSRHQAYTGLTFLSSWEFIDLQLLIGVDHYKSMYTSLKSEINIFTIPITGQNPFNPWSSSRYGVHGYGRIYIGSEIRGSFFQKEDAFTGANAHIGLTWMKSGFISRIFVQSGLGYNFSGLYSNKFHLLTQAGINLKIHNFLF